MSTDDRRRRGEDYNSRRGGTKGDAARADRLAAELRENLKRRKARARALDGQQGGTRQSPDPAIGPTPCNPAADKPTDNA